MKKRMLFLVIGLNLLLSSFLTAKTTFVTIGTGGVTGIYYPTGGALAKILNQTTKTHKIKASAEATGGSVYNINAVLQKSLELGIAQSDKQYQAYHGLEEWKAQGPAKQLRSICSFHPEIVTLVASTASKIRSLKDLKGKHVNIGDPGSGQRGNAIDIFEAAGINYQKDIRIAQLKPAEAPKKLQDGHIDAFFYTVGHPNGAIMETTNTADVRFVPITGVDNLIKKFSFYTKAEIPLNLYPKAKNNEDANKTPVESIGLRATLVTHQEQPNEVIYEITKTLFENLDTLKDLHPALKELTKEQMLLGLSAPLHPGALKYYKEKGLK